MSDRTIHLFTVLACVVIAIAVATFLTGCDRGARKDLPQENQQLDQSDADVIVMPDRFPNITHKCSGTTGFWTTTGGAVWIMFRDPDCGGEGEPFVLDNIPGSQTP